MKLNKGLLVLAAAFALGLSACGNNKDSESEFKPASSSEGTSESEDETSGQSSSEDSSSEDQSSDSSSEDSSSSESSSEDEPPAGSFAGKVEFFNGAETTPLTSVKEMSGAKNAVVTLSNLPEGKTLSNYTLELPRQSALVTLIDDGDANGDYTFQIVPMAAGVFKGAIKVKEGNNVVLSVPYCLNIEADLTLGDYTELTKAKIIELNAKTGGDNGRYYLASDIDMEGTDLPVSAATFTGSIYGAGHTIRNFSVTNESGIFLSFQGVAFDLNLEGEIKAGGAAWAGLLAKETAWRSVVSNVRAVVTDNTAAPADGTAWTWNRNGGLFGMTRGLIQDTVVDVTNCATDRTLPFAAYSYYEAAANYAMDKSNAFVDNSYTNAKGTICKPFGPDPAQGWNSDPNPDTNFVGDLAWANVTAQQFKLDTTIWNLTNGQMPTLIVK